jgi:hypothetical protein
MRGIMEMCLWLYVRIYVWVQRISEVMASDEVARLVGSGVWAWGV